MRPNRRGISVTARPDDREQQGQVVEAVAGIGQALLPHGSTGGWAESGAFKHLHGKPAPGIAPAPHHAQAGPGRHRGEILRGVLATVFDQHRLARGEGKTMRANRHDLVDAADDMRLDAPGLRVVAGAMFELVQLEIGLQLAIDPRQQVEGEFTGYPGGIVVGGFEDCRILLQIDTDQRRTLTTHFDGHRAQQADRLALLEVAQRRSRKNTTVRRAA